MAEITYYTLKQQPPKNGFPLEIRFFYQPDPLLIRFLRHALAERLAILHRQKESVFALNRSCGLGVRCRFSFGYCFGFR
ncbi:hypothetical protein GBL98_08075 [Yersinia pseudotuberculosis]|uniref:Uncharacterized protein n=1 Tax=Yersinia pseudotuberculosis TaxID=633 RepID=A0ABN5R1A5_YERPU|nr:hypothetical protein EGX47_00595 [Yersinia pseudotuberculosis]AYW94514.1 hypothetical protein EGX39_00850 [Yersinia pseudotuberculosis]AYX15202.1 hypothetical protein EGX44_08410 [Yersinia pseudotuberculosis]MBO1549401.1 hypothetical protein [Yersinia pseudotuberculosis]MBO1569555.1 hypothetical protein [Yersinia pseudotuberculosis]